MPAKFNSTAASKGKMLRRVRKDFRMRRVLKPSHEDKQRRRSFITGLADYFCQCGDLFIFVGFETLPVTIIIPTKLIDGSRRMDTEKISAAHDFVERDFG
jgi:hypothetical protein